MTKIAILGSGVVGETLANGFLAKGHAVRRSSRDPEKLADWKASAKGDASIGTFGEAAAWCDVAVLCVKGSAAEVVIADVGSALAGKLVLDTTNPIANVAPTNGVLNYFTKQNESLMERLQVSAPQAKFVKAFSCVGAPFMVDPKLDPRPTMFICGNDPGAKAQAIEMLTAFGWDSEDMGKVESARAIEALCMLWCIPGLSGGSWSHAFKLVKAR